MKNRLRVLIIDDEYLEIQGLTKFFSVTYPEMETVGFTNPEEALNYSLQHHIDIAVSDIEMPLIMGFDLCRELKKHHNCEVIMISGYDEFFYAKKSIEIGALNYILKPIDLKELSDAVDAAVGRLAERQAVIDTNNDDYVLKAVDELLEEDCRTVTLQTAAEKIGFHPSYFSVIFKEKSGMLFKDYVINFKIRKAKQMLLGSNMRISEIAETLGYSGTEHFSKVFRKATGTSPASFRHGK